MSDLSVSAPLNTDAETIEAQAAAWFVRCGFSNLSDQDQQEFELWLAEAPAHRIAYWRLTGAWAQTDRLTALRRPTPPIGDSSSGFFRYFKHAVAAIFVLAVSAAIGWMQLLKPNEQLFSTSLGGHKTIELSDGSQIELNTSTTLRVSLDKSKRSVELLSGEAFFKVRHDSARPFSVLACGHRVMDLGTEFFVRKDSQRVEVAVIQGRARFESADASIQQHSAVLTSGDVVVAYAGSMTVSKKSSTVLSNALAWRRGALIFHFTPLSEAVGELNRYNHEKLVVADTSIESRTIYGTIPTNGVQAFIGVARNVLGLRVEKRDGEFLISR
jgi:transmembrane sensor